MTPEKRIKRIQIAESLGMEITLERIKQEVVHGYGAEHDDQHTLDQLTLAAIVHAAHSIGLPMEPHWPYGFGPPPPVGTHGAARRRALVKAAALLAAEIERIDRGAPTQAHRLLRMTVTGSGLLFEGSVECVCGWVEKAGTNAIDGAMSRDMVERRLRSLLDAHITQESA